MSGKFTKYKQLFGSKPMSRRRQFKPQSRQAYDQVTTYLRPKNAQIVERTYDWLQMSYDWSQRSWVIASGKSVAARSWPCSKPNHTGLTTRLRPTCDRKMLQSLANRRKNLRLVTEVVRLVTGVVSDRYGQTSRHKVDGHVHNWSCHLTTGGTTNRLLTQNVTINRTLDRRGPRLIVRSIVYGYHWSYDFLRYDGSCHRPSPIGVDRATTRTTNRTMTYHQQKRPIALCDLFWRS